MTLTKKPNGTVPVVGDAKNSKAGSQVEFGSVEVIQAPGSKKGIPVANGTNGKAESPYDNPHLSLVDRFIDEPRSLRVAVIGGGLSGILAGVLLPKKVPGIQLTIFEKNADLVCTYNFPRCWLSANF